MQKKSLISSLKTTKKANVAAAPAKNAGGSTRKIIATRQSKVAYKKVLEDRM